MEFGRGVARVEKMSEIIFVIIATQKGTAIGERRGRGGVKEPMGGHRFGSMLCVAWGRKGGGTSQTRVEM